MIAGSRGLFDLPAPALTWLDARFSAVPEPIRLLLWAAIAAGASMGVYAALSPQGRLREIKESIRLAQARVKAYEGDFGGSLPLLWSQVALSLRHVGMTLLPALAAGLPVLVLLPWLALRFGWLLPAPGAPVAVTVRPATAVLGANPPALSGGEGGRWTLAWPEPGSPVTLRSGSDRELVRLPLKQPVPSLSPRARWNILFGNPAGYLPDDAGVEAVEIELPRRVVIAGAPQWLAGWEATFFGGMLVFALAIKRIFRLL